MSGFLLRLAGPMQSWGEHSVFGARDTQVFPTRSALTGMFASALGLHRGAPLDRFAGLHLTVRIDRPGVHMSDFHTVGGGLPRNLTVPTAEGKRRSDGQATIVTRRAYLADAVFTAAVTGPQGDTADIAAALAAPHWQPFLGRRSFVPDQPLVLRAEVDDPVSELRESVPLPWRPHPRDAADVAVDFVYEGDRGAEGADRTVAVLNDVPVSFHSRHRTFGTRAITRVPEKVPVLLMTRSDDYQRTIIDYAAGRPTCPSG